jgi:hypothetical protein
MDELTMMSAAWAFLDEDDAVRMQIELGQDHPITLTAWKDGTPPTVALWSGSGEFAFSPELGDAQGASAARFLEWLEAARSVTVTRRGFHP